MHLLKTAYLPAVVVPFSRADPIPLPTDGLQISSPLLPRAAPNWTSQAWQTHCNNIDYFGDNNECCLHLSGATWKSCNGVGWATISSSGVLCYDLTAGHDCCDDDSVCDSGLPCSNGTCSQTSTSTTVCRDGCVSYNGLGCKVGTCAHGKNVGSGTPESASSTASGTASTPGSTGTGTGAGGNGGGGLSTSDKIAIGIGVPVGVFTILGAIIAWYMCRH
jgi:hypothetical protein